MESQPPRPFGLLLMTGLNFGLGVLNLFTAGQLLVGVKMKLDPAYYPAGIDEGVKVGLHATPLWFLVFIITMACIKAPLLFTSAWGYFNHKRVAGRYVGTAYAVLSLAESAVALLLLPYGFGMNSVIGALYAIFTLLAVHGPFKAVLTR